MSVNPYAPPSSQVESIDHGMCWRQSRNTVYVAKGSDLPPRCVKCNQPAVLPVRKRTLYWHSSGWYALIVVNLLLYAIVAMFVRRKVRVSPGLCEVHAKRRRLVVGASLACALGLGFAGFEMLGGGAGGIAALCFLGAFVALVVTVVGGRIVYPVEVNERGASLKGCRPAFLASLRSDGARQGGPR